MLDTVGGALRTSESQVEKQWESQHLHSCQHCLGAGQGGQDSSGHNVAFWEVSPSARPRGPGGVLLSPLPLISCLSLRNRPPDFCLGAQGGSNQRESRGLGEPGDSGKLSPQPLHTPAALPSPGLFGAGPRKRASWLHGPGDPDTHGPRPRGRGHSYYLLGQSFTLQVCVSKARWLPLNLNAASWAQTQPLGTRVCAGGMGAATLQRKLLTRLRPLPYAL